MKFSSSMPTSRKTPLLLGIRESERSTLMSHTFFVGVGTNFSLPLIKEQQLSESLAKKCAVSNSKLTSENLQLNGVFRQSTWTHEILYLLTVTLKLTLPTHMRFGFHGYLAFQTCISVVSWTWCNLLSFFVKLLKTSGKKINLNMFC